MTENTTPNSAGKGRVHAWSPESWCAAIRKEEASGTNAPAPYYEDEWVTLYHGDCREVTPWVHADVLITDPPYGMERDISSGQKVAQNGRQRHWQPTNERIPEWNKTLQVRDEVMDLWGSIRPYAVFGTARRLDGALPCREVPLIWDKDTIGMGDTSFPWGRGYELIYVNGPGWHGRRSSPILRIHMHNHTQKKLGHPTPKPVALMRAIITKAPPGVIADPFAGTGSTLIAAKHLNRRAVGVELDERHCETAAIQLSQDSLFDDVAPSVIPPAASEGES